MKRKSLKSLNVPEVACFLKMSRMRVFVDMVVTEEINGEMLDDIRMEDLEEFGIGVKIQRRQLLRVVKRAQTEDVDVSQFLRSDLLMYAKRVREIQRERLKDIKGLDLSFLDKPLLDDVADHTSDRQAIGNDMQISTSKGKVSSYPLTNALVFLLIAIAIIFLMDSTDAPRIRNSLTQNIAALFSGVSLPDASSAQKSSRTVDLNAAPSSDERSTVESIEDPIPTSQSDDERRFGHALRTANKCFSMAPSAARWSHTYKYPSDALEHYEKLLDITQPFRVQPFHSYAGYAGPWVENHWIFYFMGRSLSDFGPYIPIFVQWTDIKLWGKPAFAEIERELLNVLRPDVMYVTVSQADDGLSSVTDLFPNILVLSAGGYGHVPIPLMKGDLQAPAVAPKRSRMVTFIGKMLGNRREAVQAAQQMLGDDFEWYRGDKWQEKISSSQYALTPRGFGRTAFAVVEAIQLGAVPIYVWDDVEWLPYRGSRNADWNTFGVSINVRDMHKIAEILRTSKPSIEEKQRNLSRLRDSHFTYKGVMHQIELFLRGGENLSDLRCIRMPKSAGVLSYGEGLEGIFGALDLSGDELISFEEFYSGFRSFKVQSQSEGTSISMSFSVDEGRSLWVIMDEDEDGFVDYQEWMQNYPRANEKMKMMVLEHQAKLGSIAGN